MTDRVIRHNKRLPESRYSPFTKGTDFTKETEKQKQEAVRLGVELSLFVAEAMFILSDDIRSVLLYSGLIFKHEPMTIYGHGPVVGSVLRVIQYVFATYIKPKNRVYLDNGKSSHWQLMKPFLENFSSRIRDLTRIVSILKIGCLVNPSDFEQYNQDLKNLEENLRSVKDVSKANGFARETIECNILHLWKKPLFETTSEVIKPDRNSINEMFRPLLNQANNVLCTRRLASLVI